MRAVFIPAVMAGFNLLFAKSNVPGRKAAPKGRPGVPAKIEHFDWRKTARGYYGAGRPAWSYRGARRNARRVTKHWIRHNESEAA